MLFLASSGGLSAQQAIPAAGNDASGTGGTCNYTIGQIAYTYNSGTSGEVNQGVQQPFEIFSTAGLNDQEIVLEVSTYPNPTSKSLTIKVGEYSQKTLSYQLFDIQGNLVEEKVITQNETPVSMEHVVNSTYLLQIIGDDQLIKTFKIIKN